MQEVKEIPQTLKMRAYRQLLQIQVLVGTLILMLVVMEGILEMEARMQILIGQVEEDQEGVLVVRLKVLVETLMSLLEMEIQIPAVLQIQMLVMKTFR